MNFIKRNSKHFSVGLTVIGMLLIALSLFLTRTPLSADIWLYGGDEPDRISIDSPFAANWLLKAGIHVYPHDSVWYRGIAIPSDLKLPVKNGQQLIYKPAVPILIRTAGEDVRFYSGAQTLGEALWEKNIFVKISDDLSYPLDTPLDQALTVSLLRSQPVQITTGGKVINASVSALTVGGALAEAGLSLQLLDYCIPAASEPIPEDRTIQIVRVREEILTEEVAIPFNIERVPDPNMTVGEEQIVQAGEDGVQSSTVMIRYEDGEETERTVLAQRVTKAPVAQRTAYGGNVVVQTFDSSEGAVDYWLAKDVFITSYLDTGSKTASGLWPYYGVIAVAPDWYSILKGTSIYVPGYGVGTVLDVCPGCVGKPWIDVFIPTDQYVPWSRTETVYFLPPAPAGFTGELP